jgi:hypothetical protein
VNDKAVWRWNANPVWHYFCSMQYEAYQAKTANNDFMRYHHVRSCVFYAVSVIEALLNSEMRRYMQEQGASEIDILKRLRNTRFQEKREKWPSEICGKPVKFNSSVVKLFETHRSIRDEVTHPKRRDHSIYVELDQAAPDSLVDAIARAIVTLCEARSVPFPYWVLGWNYVGMNNNPAHPLESNNLNGFLWSFRGMGFGVNTSDIHWERQHMTSMAGYEALKEALARYPADIEPYWKDFPLRPRLTRRWWDHEFIIAAFKAAGTAASGSD